MCSLDLDPCTIWRETPRVARKAHECDCCGAVIRQGTHYLEHFNVFDGDVSSERACFACWAARLEFASHHGRVTQPSSFWETLAECWGEEGRRFWTAEDRHWRDVQAGIVRRWRTSPRGRNHLAKKRVAQ